MVGITPKRMRPDVSPFMRETTSFIELYSFSASRACPMTASPALVGMTGFLERSRSIPPNSSSSDLICMLNDG